MSTDRSAPQHLDDIIIPVIEIDRGWPVTDIKTIEDCDDAYAFLSSAIAQIEYDIEVETFKAMDLQDREWSAKARCALRYKKAALQIIATRRARIHSDIKKVRQDASDRKLIAFIRQQVSDDVFMHWVAKCGCDDEETGEPT